MTCKPAGGCWCMEMPPLSPMPATDDAWCLCQRCLTEIQMLASPATIQTELGQLEAAFKAAARPEPPADAKPGEWLCGHVDYIEHPGGYRQAVGPQMWTPRYLSLARVLLMRDPGRSH